MQSVTKQDLSSSNPIPFNPFPYIVFQHHLPLLGNGIEQVQDVVGVFAPLAAHTIVFVADLLNDESHIAQGVYVAVYRARIDVIAHPGQLMHAAAKVVVQQQHHLQGA